MNQSQQIIEAMRGRKDDPTKPKVGDMIDLRDDNKPKGTAKITKVEWQTQGGWLVETDKGKAIAFPWTDGAVPWKSGGVHPPK